VDKPFRRIARKLPSRLFAALADAIAATHTRAKTRLAIPRGVATWTESSAAVQKPRPERQLTHLPCFGCNNCVRITTQSGAGPVQSTPAPSLTVLAGLLGFSSDARPACVRACPDRCQELALCGSQVAELYSSRCFLSIVSCVRSACSCVSSLDCRRALPLGRWPTQGRSALRGREA
jgi:hypothetical protein